jgi:hypothetical protein
MARGLERAGERATNTAKLVGFVVEATSWRKNAPRRMPTMVLGGDTILALLLQLYSSFEGEA